MPKIYYIFLVLIVTSSNASTAIYKCKQVDGNINYSSTPCPKGLKSEPISTTKQKIHSKGTSKVLSFDKIKTASDGLSQINIDGFGNIKLSDLKEQLKVGKDINNEIVFFQNDFWKHYIVIMGDPKTEKIFFYYSINGINYDLYDNPQKEREFNENDQSTHLNVTTAEVNRHAISIGLKSKPKAAAYHIVKWDWEKDGFKCELDASVQVGLTPHRITQTCTLN